MSEETFIRHCSPTLAGIKTGNLFRCSYRTQEEMRSDVRHWNTVLSPKGLRVIPLRFGEDSALIYVYRPARLQKDLENGDACALLRERGYCTENPSRCVACLIERLKESQEFPHEIGLFLSYPPEDVTGFLEHREADCKCTGFWKVYGDAEAAQKTFARYKKCIDAYYRAWKNGRTLDRLTVPGRTCRKEERV